MRRKRSRGARLSERPLPWLAALFAGATACSALSGPGGGVAAPATAPPAAQVAVPPAVRAGGYGDAARLAEALDPGDRGLCRATDKLIPTCGAWWGIAPEVPPGVPVGRAVAWAERRMGRRADIVHLYHRGRELFPDHRERALAGSRMLLIDWTPSARVSWRRIAEGALDARIDRLAAFIRSRFTDRFFLALAPTPEEQVRRRGAGWTAADYAAMYRHVVTRLRAGGVRNAVMVMTYTGDPKWMARPWFSRLYPGGDVVDWVAIAPRPDGPAQDFAGLVDKVRSDVPEWPGLYRWMQTRFPGKPIMVAEWGVLERPENPAFKRAFFASVRRQIRRYPQIKALVYYDSSATPAGDTRFDTTPASARAFSALARAAYFSSTLLP